MTADILAAYLAAAPRSTAAPATPDTSHFDLADDVCFSCRGTGRVMDLNAYSHDRECGGCDGYGTPIDD